MPFWSSYFYLEHQKTQNRTVSIKEKEFWKTEAGKNCSICYAATLTHFCVRLFLDENYYLFGISFPVSGGTTFQERQSGKKIARPIFLEFLYLHLTVNVELSVSPV